MDYTSVLVTETGNAFALKEHHWSGFQLIVIIKKR